MNGPDPALFYADDGCRCGATEWNRRPDTRGSLPHGNSCPIYTAAHRRSASEPLSGQAAVLLMPGQEPVALRREQAREAELRRLHAGDENGNTALAWLMAHPPVHVAGDY